MNSHALFRDIAAVSESLEGEGASVVGVETPEGMQPMDDPEVELSVEVPISELVEAPETVSVVARDATVEDGELRVRLAIEPATDGGSGKSAEGERESSDVGAHETSRPDEGESASREEAAASPEEPVSPDGGATMEVDEPDRADGEEASAGVPAYQDPARLEAVYDRSKSFREMTEELDVDVTPQTVRRYMIEHGIHESRSDGEQGRPSEPEESAEGGPSTDADPEANAEAGDFEADGGRLDVDALDVDLPSGVSLAAVRESVASARTVYEVQRALGLERAETRSVLEELGLLEYVTGRLARADEEITPEDVDERIRETLAVGT